MERPASIARGMSLAGKGNNPALTGEPQRCSPVGKRAPQRVSHNAARQRGNPCCLRSRGMRVNGSSAARVSDAQAPWGATDA
ncbi:hypothetical protein NVIRENTERO_01834 [Sodalis praecaptivus]|nr:hypothetical protein NVIRENTERO_01834 [Sodalis praecaptivus]